jgi:hypothetical protein
MPFWLGQQVAVAQAETPMTSLVAWHSARVLKLKWDRNVCSCDVGRGCVTVVIPAGMQL